MATFYDKTFGFVNSMYFLLYDAGFLSFVVLR